MWRMHRSIIGRAHLNLNGQRVREQPDERLQLLRHSPGAKGKIKCHFLSRFRPDTKPESSIKRRHTVAIPPTLVPSLASRMVL